MGADVKGSALYGGNYGSILESRYSFFVYLLSYFIRCIQIYKIMKYSKNNSLVPLYVLQINIL